MALSGKMRDLWFDKEITLHKEMKFSIKDF